MRLVSLPPNRAADVCLVLVALTAVLVVITSSGNRDAAQGYQPWVGQLRETAASAPLPAGQPLAATELARGESSSLHMVQVRSAVVAHYHASHDETVCVVSGRGRMQIAEREVWIGPGSVLYIPRGTVHAVVNADTTQLLIAMSSFAPAFDGEDRVFVGEE